MAASPAHDQFRLGFLSAVEDDERGVVGGLLVTNRFGRPLEFQCTTPVKPNRTQQILFGPQLRPYVLTELIGKTLIEKVGVKPHLILLESPELLALREHVSLPVACLGKSSPPADAVTIGKQWLQFHDAYEVDHKEIAKQAGSIPDTADLKEPFDRIREALAETIKSHSTHAA
ncbi:MAG: hypothetical protein U0872_15815 [Planctomycetaceae bacterium]